MKQEVSGISYEIHKDSPVVTYISIAVPQDFVSFVYRQTLELLQSQVHAPGFARGAAPLEYIAYSLKETIADHLEEFFLQYCVIKTLYKTLRKEKVLITGSPRIHSVDLDLPNSAAYTFEVVPVQGLALLEWQYFPFKAPKRKNYKDLDRQVESFIKEEKEKSKNCDETCAQVGDWVGFSIKIIDPLSRDTQTLTEDLWLKLGEEDVDVALRSLFVGRKLHETFVTDSIVLQSYFSLQLQVNYSFEITITGIVKNAFFCLEQLKHHFKLKTNKEIQQRLIEVFSYRNDISLRRNIAEDSLRLLLTKHKFEIPNSLVLRHQQQLLADMQHNPDYHVYRVQKDFQASLRQLAEKQSKEAVMMDAIMHNDSMDISENDVKSYLTLMQRPRTKEFIYFGTPLAKNIGQEMPMSSEYLKLFCGREKMLNHVIHTLIRH